MLIRKFGIELRRITSDDIETIRLWRNQDFVRKNMHYTQPISASQQKEWFEKLDPKCNLYFIIIHRGFQIGLINLKDINWKYKEAEAGIFVGEEIHLDTITPILATIAVMDLAFDVLKLEKLKAKINKQNAKAIKFNKSIGYVYGEDIDEVFTYYYCTGDLFSEAIGSFRSTINKLSTSDIEFTITTHELQELGLSTSFQKGLKTSIV